MTDGEKNIGEALARQNSIGEQKYAETIQTRDTIIVALKKARVLKKSPLTKDDILSVITELGIDTAKGLPSLTRKYFSVSLNPEEIEEVITRQDN